MPQHIGIVACSAEGAALCYRTISLEGAQMLGPHDHPEVSLHSSLACAIHAVHPRRTTGRALPNSCSLPRKSWPGRARTFLFAPDNTIHQAFDLVEHRSPRPWLHIAREVAKEAKRRQFKRLAVLGTRYLMEGPVYREALKAAGIEHRIPGAEQRERLDQIIMDELVNAQFLPRSLNLLRGSNSLAQRRRLRRGRPRLHRNPAAGHAGILAAASLGFDTPTGQSRSSQSGRRLKFACGDSRPRLSGERSER